MSAKTQHLKKQPSSTVKRSTVMYVPGI